MKKLFLLAFALGGVVSSQAAIVFDTDANYTGNVYASNSLYDDVLFGGTERYLTEISFWTYQFQASSFDYVVEFYNLSVDHWTVGSLIYQSPVQSVQGLSGWYNPIIALPFVFVPDDVLWGITVSNLTQGENPYMAIAHPATVGSSEDRFYSNGAWYWFGGAPPASWDATIRAELVPEPASLLALGFGGLALILRRRR